MTRDMKIRDKPLVSITIPTYNEEKALPMALAAISRQSCADFEVIVIDSNSTDRTKSIATGSGAKVINYEGKLLGARFLGVKESRGDYVLLLDADQILKKDTLERASAMIQDYDMLVFEEDSYEPRTYVQKAISRERETLHKRKGALDPAKGGLLPRFFRRDTITRTFQNIPENLFPIVVAHDHALIYWEASKISEKIGILPDAVSHIEAGSITELLKHHYNFGKSTRVLARTGLYHDVFSKKSFQPRNVGNAIQTGTFFIAFLRSTSSSLGYLMA